MRPTDQTRIQHICDRLQIKCRPSGLWLIIGDDQMFSEPNAAARWLGIYLNYHPEIESIYWSLHHASREWLTRQALIDAPVVKRRYTRRKVTL